MKVLAACEESQAVTKEFRKLGHEAYSCDIVECSGGHPEWHLQQDVTALLRERWDMIVAFPPCTYLTVAGNRWFNVSRYGEAAMERQKNREEAVKFFMQFVNADCQLIAIENPIGVMSRIYKKPDQIIQPYEYGHPFTKNTCLWLKGLPKLRATNIIEKPESGWENQQFTKDGRYGGFGGKFGCKKDGKWMRYSDPEVKKARSKTFPGIAKAMAEQWGKLDSGANVPDYFCAEQMELFG